MLDVTAASHKGMTLLQGDRRASGIIQVESDAVGVLRGVILKQAGMPHFLCEERDGFFRHRRSTRAIDSRDAVENKCRDEHRTIEGGYTHIFGGAGVRSEFTVRKLMVVQKPQSPSNRRSRPFQSYHGRKRATVLLCTASLRGTVGQALIRLGKVRTLFTAHHYRIRDRRHRGNVGACFEHKSDDELPDRRATLESRGDCWLNSRGLDLTAS